MRLLTVTVRLSEDVFQAASEMAKKDGYSLEQELDGFVRAALHAFANRDGKLVQAASQFAEEMKKSF